jgi:hypothetical protein
MMGDKSTGTDHLGECEGCNDYKMICQGRRHLATFGAQTYEGIVEPLEIGSKQIA